VIFLTEGVIALMSDSYGMNIGDMGGSGGGGGLMGMIPQ
jgi:hypothetical protein